MASRNYRVALLPGDGVGPEITEQGRKALAAAAARFGFGIEFETGYSDTDLKAEHTPSVAALTALLFRYARSPTPQSGASRAPHTPRHDRCG